MAAQKRYGPLWLWTPGAGPELILAFDKIRRYLMKKRRHFSLEVVNRYKEIFSGRDVELQNSVQAEIGTCDRGCGISVDAVRAVLGEMVTDENAKECASVLRHAALYAAGTLLCAQYNRTDGVPPEEDAAAVRSLIENPINVCTLLRRDEE